MPEVTRADCEQAWDACVAKHRTNLAVASPRWLAWLLLWDFDRRMARTRARMIAEMERRLIQPLVQR